MIDHSNLSLENWVEIGVITSAYGIKGELKVTSLTDFPERFETAGERLLISPDEKQQRRVNLLSGRYLAGKNQVIVCLETINNRNQAEALRGYKLMAIKGESLPLDDDEYPVYRLINITVYLQSNQQPIGRVTDVFFAGNDLLEIELNSPDIPPKKALIPLVKEIVPLIDLDHNRIEINPPAGLLDL